MNETHVSKWKNKKYESKSHRLNKNDAPAPSNHIKSPLLDKSLMFPSMTTIQSNSQNISKWFSSSSHPIIEGAVGKRSTAATMDISGEASSGPGRQNAKLSSLSYNINLYENNSSINSVFQNSGNGYIPSGTVIDVSYDNMPIYYWNHLYSSMTDQEINNMRVENQLNSYLLNSYKIDKSGNLIPTYNDQGKFNIIDAYYYAQNNLDPKWKSRDKDQKFINYALLTNLTDLYADSTNAANGQETVASFTTDSWRRAYAILVYKMTWIDSTIVNTYDVSSTDMDISFAKIISYDYDPNMPYFYWNHIFSNMTEDEKSNVRIENYMNYYLLHGLVYDCGQGQINDFYMGNGTPNADKSTAKIIPDLIQNLVKYIAKLDRENWKSKDKDQANINKNLLAFFDLAKSSTTDTSGNPIDLLESAYTILTKKMIKGRIRLISTGSQNVIGNVKKKTRIIENFETLGTLGGVTFNFDNSITNKNSANGQLKMPMGTYNSGGYFMNNPDVYQVPSVNQDNNLFDQINNMYVPDLFGQTDEEGNPTAGGGNPAIENVANSVITVVNSLLMLILLPIFSMQYFIQLITDGLCDGITGGATLNDKVCVYNSATMVVTYFLCIYIFLNWYFILRHRENGYAVKLIDVSWKNLKQNSVFLGFLFKYLICQVSFINACILIIQKYSEKLDKRLFMVLQFLFTVVAVAYFGFSNTIFELLTGSGGIAKGLCIVYMFIFAGYSLMTQDIGQTLSQFSSIIMFILTIIIFILRIIFSILVVFIAISLIGIYLFVYSYFGIFLYNKTSFSDVLQKMYESWIIGYEATNMDKYTECRKRSWGEWFQDTWKLIVRTFVGNMFMVIFFFMVVYITYLYFNILDNISLAAILILVNIGVMGFIIYYLFFQSKTYPADPNLMAKVEEALGVKGTIEPKAEIETIRSTFQNLRTEKEQEQINMFKSAIAQKVADSAIGKKVNSSIDSAKAKIESIFKSNKRKELDKILATAGTVEPVPKKTPIETPVTKLFDTAKNTFENPPEKDYFSVEKFSKWFTPKDEENVPAQTPSNPSASKPGPEKPPVTNM